MRSLALLLTLLFCLDVRAEAPVLATKALFGGKLSILLPGDFQPMTQELLKRKYPNANPPSIVYSDERAVINVAFEHTPHRVTPEQLPSGLEELKKVYANAYPTAKWFRSELTQINERKFLLFDLRTPSATDNVRNIVVCTSLEDRLLVVSFNVIESLEPLWITVGNQIIRSIEIK